MRIFASGTVLAIGLLVLHQAGVSVAAEVPAPAPAGSTLLASELDTNSVVELLEPLRERAGFGALRVDEANDSVTAFWKGEPPQELYKVRKIAESAGVSLIVAEAPFSERELESATDIVTTRAVRSQLPVESVFFGRGNSGLSVEVNSARADGKSPRIGEISRILEDATDVPLTISTVPGESLDRGRNNMAAPFKGGGILTFSNGNVCTSGFPVAINGIGHLLSAGHCAPQGNPAWVENGVGDRVTTGGHNVDVASAYDSLLIDPTPSPATVGKIFHGGRNTNTKVSVARANSPARGQRVCVSGANTGGTRGSSCTRAVIYEVGQFRCGATSNDHWCPGFRVRSTESPRQVIGGAGDSGGPVYVMRNDGRVGARGIYVSGVRGYQDFCRGIRYGGNGPTRCDTRINVVQINRLLTRWGAVLETSS